MKNNEYVKTLIWVQWVTHTLRHEKGHRFWCPFFVPLKEFWFGFLKSDATCKRPSTRLTVKWGFWVNFLNAFRREFYGKWLVVYGWQYFYICVMNISKIVALSLTIHFKNKHTIYRYISFVCGYFSVKKYLDEYFLAWSVLDIAKNRLI